MYKLHAPQSAPWLPHMHLEDLLRDKQYYRDEENWKALLRKLYCRLSLRIINNNSSSVTVNVLGYPQPTSEQTTYSQFSWVADHEAAMPYIAGQLVNGFAEYAPLNEVWGIQSNNGTTYGLYIFDDNDGSVKYDLSLLSSVRPVSIVIRSNWAYVLCNQASGTTPAVVIYNTETRDILATRIVGNPGDEMSGFVYCNGYYYIGNITQQSVYVFQTGPGDTFTAVASVALSGDPYSLAANTDTNEVYVTVDGPGGSSNVSVIDATTNTLTTTITPTSPQTFGGGVCFNNQDNLIYVTSVDISANQVYVYSIDSSYALTLVLAGGASAATLRSVPIVANRLPGYGLIASLDRAASATLSFFDNSQQADYQVSTSAYPSWLFTSSQGTLYVASSEYITIYMASESTTQSTLPDGVEIITSASNNLSYEGVLYDVFYNPLLVRHTHVYYDSNSQLSNLFQLVYTDSAGFRWSDIYPMRLWQSNSQPDQRVQEIFSWNDVVFDGRQSLNVTLNANSEIFIEFYYIKVSMNDLLRKKLLADYFRLPDERPELYQSDLFPWGKIAQLNENTGTIM